MENSILSTLNLELTGKYIYKVREYPILQISILPKLAPSLRYKMMNGNHYHEI